MTATSTPQPGTLDPAAAALLASIKESGFPGWAYLTIPQARAMMATMRPLAGEPEPVAHVEDMVIPGSPDIPARLYRPHGDAPPALIVYFHAGGWALGDYEDIDTPVRALVNRSVYPGMVHGFWQLGGVLPQGLTAIGDVASVLRSHLTSQAVTGARLPA